MKDLTVFQEKVFEVRGKKVMLDVDVAEALGVPTKELQKNVSRSKKWIYLKEQGLLDQYCFQLTDEEYDTLQGRWQNASAAALRRTLPYVYTELGCAHFGTSMTSPAACALAIQLSKSFVVMQKVARGEISYVDQKSAIALLYGKAFDILSVAKKAALLLGNTNSLANAHAVQSVSREIPEVSFKHMLTQNVSDVQDALSTATELGREVGSWSPQQVNKALLYHGLQTKDNSNRWIPTEKGKDYCQWLDTGKEHSDGEPIRSLKWYREKTLKVLIGEKQHGFFDQV